MYESWLHSHSYLKVVLVRSTSCLGSFSPFASPDVLVVSCASLQNYKFVVVVCSPLILLVPPCASTSSCSCGWSSVAWNCRAHLYWSSCWMCRSRKGFVRGQSCPVPNLISLHPWVGGFSIFSFLSPVPFLGCLV